MVKEGLTEKVTSGQIFKGNEGKSHEDIKGRQFQAEGI